MKKHLLHSILTLTLSASVMAGCTPAPATTTSGSSSTSASTTAAATTTPGTTTASATTTAGTSGTIATAEEVAAALKDGSAIVVDARTGDAYAGWAADGNKLGGHIKGATDFSANWLTATFDDKENLDGMTREEHLQKYLTDKKLKTASSVIVYDETGIDAKAVADYFTKSGIKGVKTFALADWKEDLVKYPQYQLYVPPTVVNDLISGKEVAEIGAVKDLKILEVSWGKTEESGFLNGHVPGALHVNSDDFDDENNYYLLDPDESLFALVKSLGITTESTVITTGSPIFSARMAIILKYLGVEDVYVMSGGTTDWADAGFELEKTDNQPTPVADFGRTTPKNPDIIDTVDEVIALRSDPNFLLVDNRTEEEYKGETSGYSYFDKAGRIEGAVYGFAGVGNSSSMLFYDNLDTTMRNGYEILDMWKTAGVDTAKHLSFYCGGGYRAAEVLWDAYVMGLDNVSLFADGWCGWAAAGNESVKD